MKTRPQFLTTIALALPLGLWAPPDATAQTNGQSRPVQERLAHVIVRSPEVATNGPVFYFPGGTPREFMQAVDKCYQVDWLSIARIPEEMESVQLPTLRVPRYPDGRAPSGLPEVRDLVRLYNSLAGREPKFGTLLLEGDSTKPSAVMLVPSEAGDPIRSQVRVKAFPIQGIHRPDWKKLEKDIDSAREEAVNYGNIRRKGIATARLFEGQVSFHKDTGLLVAVGSEPYLEMVESIVAAHKANQSPVVENLVAPTNK
jgi:hypothetical protein